MLGSVPAPSVYIWCDTTSMPNLCSNSLVDQAMSKEVSGPIRSGRFSFIGHSLLTICENSLKSAEYCSTLRCAPMPRGPASSLPNCSPNGISIPFALLAFRKRSRLVPFHAPIQSVQHAGGLLMWQKVSGSRQPARWRPCSALTVKTTLQRTARQKLSTSAHRSSDRHVPECSNPLRVVFVTSKCLDLQAWASSGVVEYVT
mmetsp:Transcript_17664/g.38537  ORF Transcript_17664/g.38537 Transcript_17664/m.38537 type:complete len:201 (-) Transcript_17664:1001-1603(-)